MRVHIPGPLRSYSNGKNVIDAAGSTVGELLAEIDRLYPGFRFRIIDEQDGVREHIKIFVNEDQVYRLSETIEREDVVHIICSLSGGI